MNVDTIRLSERAKTQLVTMKRRTGVQHWNVLCRWAFCLSLAEPSVPPKERFLTTSNVEMSWKVFSGSRSDVYLALLKLRCRHDGRDCSRDADLFDTLRLHIHRGISYLLSVESLPRLLGRSNEAALP